MTAPPPGYPPPHVGGHPVPPPPPRRVLPKEAYTPWSRRAVAFLIDWAPIYLVFVVPMGGLLATDGAECFNAIYGSRAAYCTTSSSDVWVYTQFVGLLAAPIYFLWNFCYRQESPAKASANPP